MEIKRWLPQMFARKTASPLMSKEVSSSESDISASYMLKKYNPDSLVGKKGLKIYQDMKTDDQVKASLTIKKFARLCTGWEIKPGDETNTQSVEMADFVRYVFAKMKGTFEKDLLNIMTALDYGYSLSEKVFGIYGEGKYKGKIGLMKLGAREPFGYDFKTDAHNNIVGITFESANLLSGNEGWGTDAKPYPPEKFVIYSYNAEHDCPYGTSDLRAAYGAWWSKKLNIKWWNIFNERFGMPTVMAKYPSKGKGMSKEAITQIDDILKNLQAKSGFRIPDNITFELLEATRQGAVSYGEAIDKYDGMISRSILIPNLLGLQEQGEAGSYALGKKHFDVFMFVLEMLGRDLEETVVGEQIIRPLVEMNFGEVDIDMQPKFVFEALEEDETDAKSKIIRLLADGGLVDKREEWVREYLNLPERDLDKFPHMNPVGEVDKDPEPSFPGVEIDPLTGKRRLPAAPPSKTPGKLPERKGPKDEIPSSDNEPKKMQLSRELNKYERKVNFQELDEEITFISTSLQEELEPVLIGWRDDILKKADKLVRERDMNGVNKLQIRGVGEFKTTLRDVMIKTYLDSKLHSIEELVDVGFPATIKRKFGLLSHADFATEPWDPIPPQEALDFFNKKVIVTVSKEGQSKKNLPLAKSAELNYYDKRAFTITGIESEHILGQAKLLIEKGIRDGLLKETERGLRDIFTKYIEQGGKIDGKVLTPSRLETIVRTNVNEAINEGRMQMYKDPDVDDFVPYLMWSSVMDNRTSDYCMEMDGKIFRKDEVLQPPAHFNCRSTVVPITKVEVEEEPVEISDWSYMNAKLDRSPSFGGTGKKVVEEKPKVAEPKMSGHHVDREVFLPEIQRMEKIQNMTGFAGRESLEIARDVEYWGNHGYMDIREAQAKNLVGTPLKRAERLESFIDKAPGYEGWVERGVKLTTPGLIDAFKNIKVGDIIGDNGLTSWTTDHNIAMGFSSVPAAQGEGLILRTTSVGIQKATSIKGFTPFPNEEEIIVSKTAQFRVLSKREADRRIYLDVEEVR
jgi:SPP1 gp7 family putative phage head morphogenesis protein